jgi:hypothetical protein
MDEKIKRDENKRKKNTQKVGIEEKLESGKRRKDRKRREERNR